MNDEQIREVLCEYIGSQGFLCEEVIVQHGKTPMLQVFVDTERGITLDETAAITSSVSLFLETMELFGGKQYRLEISSPGVDRPLRQPYHWERHKDRLVDVVFCNGQSIRGRVRSVENGKAVMEHEDESVIVSFDEVDSAQVVVECKKRG